MADRIYHSIESLGTTRTDSISGASYADKFTLSYQPDATSDYLTWGVAEFNHQTATTDTFFELYDSVGGAQMEEINVEPDSAADEWKNCALLAKQTFASSPASQTVKGRFRTESVGNWTDIRNARGGALKLTSNDAIAISDSQQNITATESNSTWYSTAGALTKTTVAGDHVLIAYCQHGINTLGINAQLRVDIDGSTQSEAWETTHKDTSNWTSWSFVDILTLTAASHTFTIQALRSGGTFRLRHYRLILLSLAEFFATYSNKDFTRSTTTSTSYTNIGPSVTFTPENEDHLIITNWAIDGTSGTNAGFTELSDGTTQYNESKLTSISTTKPRQQSVFSMFIKNLPASSQTFAVNGKVASGNTLGVDEGIIFIAQLTSSGISVDLTSGTLTLSGSAPSIGSGIALPTQDLLLSGSAPTVEISGTTNVDLPSGSLLLSGDAPDVVNPVGIDLIAGELELSGDAPTVGVSADLNVPLTSGTLTLSGDAPEVFVENPVDIELIPADLEIVGDAPEVEITEDTELELSSGTLTLSGDALTLTHNLQLTSGSLALSGTAPTVSNPVGVQLTSGSLSLSGSSPDVVASAHVGVTLSSGSLVLSGDPLLVQSGLLVIELTSGTLALAGSAPTVVQDTGIQLSSGNLELASTPFTICLTQWSDVAGGSNTYVDERVPTNPDFIPMRPPCKVGVDSEPHLFAGVELDFEITDANLIQLGYGEGSYGQWGYGGVGLDIDSITHMSIGTGAGDFDEGNPELIGVELARVAATVEVFDTFIKIRATFLPENGNGMVREVGLHTASSGGTTLFRIPSHEVDKKSYDSLRANVTLSFAS